MRRTFPSSRWAIVAVLMLWVMGELKAQSQLAVGSEIVDPTSPSKVLVVSISDQEQFMVDKVQADHVIKAISKAENEGYTHLVISINTFGGIVMNAREIAERLIRTKVTTIAFVEEKAISAGAFISWACDRIVMSPGSSFGDAQMIQMTLDGIEVAPEKFVSLYRSDWQKYSEAKGRPFSVAQAFFDVECELLWIEGKNGRQFVLRDDIKDADPSPTIVEVVNKKGQLLTLHADKAASLGLVSLSPDLETLIQRLGSPIIDRLEMTHQESLMRFLGANDWIFSLLVLIGLHALYTEMKAPGFGVAGMTSILCFTLVFGSRFVLGSASHLELFVFVLGVALCVAEIFFVPGFGVTGLAGLGCMFFALLMASLPDISPFELPETGPIGPMFHALLIKLSLTFVVSLLSFMVLLPTTLKLAMARGGASTPDMNPSQGYVVDTLQDRHSLMGVACLAVGDLRPSGRVRHPDGRLLDAKTRGHLIPAGSRVTITGVDGNVVIVEEGGHHA
ncbi:MAG: nodulation protein NfeD [Planctomycetota bacterium]